MKNQSVFIKFPWSYAPGNEIFVTSDQVKVAFKIISKAFLTKLKYEVETENGNRITAQKYDLFDIVVFNSFVEQVDKKILDPVAHEYVMKCVREIRDCKYNKNAKVSFQTLLKLCFQDELKQELFAEFLASDTNHFVNFYQLFKNSSKSPLTKESKEIKEITTAYNLYYDKYVNNIRS